MILEHMHDEAKFREAVRAWLPQVLATQPMKGASGDQRYEPIQRWWVGELNKVGLGTPHWPSAYGGVGLSLRLQTILAEEYARADAPALPMMQISLNHIPATLMHWGSEYQKRRYLPEVAKGVVWCQGFSEPGAGSDLASLRTRAENRGDHYLVNGQKIWSSYSMYAERAILLTRTDPTAAKHAGITYFLLDVKAPGVEVRPIKTANGRAKFAEIFLTDVRIPIEERVGEEGQGWAVAQTTLAAERGMYSFEQAERFRYAMERVHRDSVAAGLAWTREPELRRRFIQLFGRMQAIRGLLRDLLFSGHEGTAAMLAAASLKVLSCTLRKDYGAFLTDAFGPQGQIEHDDDSDEIVSGGMFVYLSGFGAMMGGGTNEIMRNIIAERGLGMPKG